VSGPRQHLDPSITRNLFEPFFSSETRSTGMGLYVGRELCDRYQPKLDYQRTPVEKTMGNEFFLLIQSVRTHES